MAEQWLGIVVSGGQFNAVHLSINGTEAVIKNQFTWKLQTGDEAEAYFAIYERVKDYVANNDIHNVVLKASAVGKNTPTLAHLKSAELRGVITAASVAGGARTDLVQKGTISRTFGARKVDEYIKDDSFWKGEYLEDLTKSRREAAILVLSQRS